MACLTQLRLLAFVLMPAMGAPCVSLGSRMARHDSHQATSGPRLWSLLLPLVAVGDERLPAVGFAVAALHSGSCRWSFTHDGAEDGRRLFCHRVGRAGTPQRRTWLG